jgi:hypothetical protein
LVCHNQLGITLIQIRLSPISLTAQLGLTHTESHLNSTYTITQIAYQFIQSTSLQLIKTKLTNKSHKTASPSRATPSPGSAPTWLNFLP